MLRFEDHEDFVEIALASKDTGDFRSTGDTYLTIRISSHGFVGENQVWVLGPILRSFCQSLIALEHNRQGEAILGSISPGELRLSIRSIDHRGHMSIEGITGYEVQRENSKARHSIEFGFEFDPSQLLRATSADWVKANAGLPT
jgi:hypothetical protein